MERSANGLQTTVAVTTAMSNGTIVASTVRVSSSTKMSEGTGPLVALQGSHIPRSERSSATAPYTFADDLAADISEESDNDENDYRSAEEVLLSTLDSTTDEKLTTFAIRLVLSGYRGIPREGELDFLTEADAAFRQPKPKYHDRPAAADIAFCVAAFASDMAENSMVRALEDDYLWRDPSPSKCAAYIRRMMTKARRLGSDLMMVLGFAILQPSGMIRSTLKRLRNIHVHPSGLPWCVPLGLGGAPIAYCLPDQVDRQSSAGSSSSADAGKLQAVLLVQRESLQR